MITHRARSRRWQAHPKLKGRFNAEHPNELLVIAHDGGPHLTERRPELVLVEVTGCDGEVFTGTVLYQPIQLHCVRLGQQIRFIVPAGARYPVLVTDKYLLERALWRIQPCTKCGFSELFDAPSDLMRVLFPKTVPASGKASFNSPCPLCGGRQAVLAKLERREPYGTAAKRRSR